MSETSVDVYYLNLPVSSADQASSLANYLSAHGIPAEGETDQVVCPLPQRGAIARQHRLIRQLHQSWKLFWENSDSELYGLPVYVKPSVGCSQGCSTP